MCREHYQPLARADERAPTGRSAVRRRLPMPMCRRRPATPATECSQAMMPDQKSTTRGWHSHLALSSLRPMNAGRSVGCRRRWSYPVVVVVVFRRPAALAGRAPAQGRFRHGPFHSQLVLAVAHERPERSPGIRTIGRSGRRVGYIEGQSDGCPARIGHSRTTVNTGGERSHAAWDCPTAVAESAVRGSGVCGSSAGTDPDARRLVAVDFETPHSRAASRTVIRTGTAVSRGRPRRRSSSRRFVGQGQCLSMGLSVDLDLAFCHVTSVP
jgi:hypothetical protein